MDKKYFEIEGLDWYVREQEVYEEWWLEAGKDEEAVRLFKTGDSLNQEDDVEHYNPRKALEFFEQAVELGYAPAMDEYASIISACLIPDTEVEVEQDIDRAVELLNKAIDDHYYPAYSSLAWMYWQGMHGEPNIQKAIELYQKAAVVGDPHSQFALAHIMDHHLGKSWDAENWYSLALTGSLAEAAVELGRMYLIGRGEGTSHPEAEDFPVNYFRAFSCFLHAYRLGCQEALKYIADCYFYGLGVKTNKDAAIGMYAEASDYDEYASYSLGRIYIMGDGADQDSTKAIEYWTKGAEQDYSVCLCELGNFYAGEYGDSCIDLDKALYWYQRGAELGDEDCLQRINSHERGEW